MEAGLNFPSTNFYADGMHVTVNSHENLLARGMDPKPLVLDFCKPQCIYWKEKLERCESKLEIVVKTNPTKTCIYAMRDWVTCVEACVSTYSALKSLDPTKGAQSTCWHRAHLLQDIVSNIINNENNNTIYT